jgi:hypothetical protein
VADLEELVARAAQPPGTRGGRCRPSSWGRRSRPGRSCAPSWGTSARTTSGRAFDCWSVEGRGTSIVPTCTRSLGRSTAGTGRPMCSSPRAPHGPSCASPAARSTASSPPRSWPCSSWRVCLAHHGGCMERSPGLHPQTSGPPAPGCPTSPAQRSRYSPSGSSSSRWSYILSSHRSCGCWRATGVRAARDEPPAGPQARAGDQRDGHGVSPPGLPRRPRPTPS